MGHLVLLRLLGQSQWQKKLGKPNSKFKKDDIVTTLPLLPDVLEALRTTHKSIRVSDIPSNLLYPSDSHKVS